MKEIENRLTRSLPPSSAVSEYRVLPLWGEGARDACVREGLVWMAKHALPHPTLHQVRDVGQKIHTRVKARERELS